MTSTFPSGSKEMHEYFQQLQNNVNKLNELATQARQKGYDPAPTVEVKLAANMAERVVGLISVLAPQIINSGVVERIIELEQQYGTLDWRVALIISKEIAEEKYCKFKDKKEAMEIGIRTGFAYATVGVVSSPLDGIVNIEIKQRLDGKEYICVNYAGPIRNAGGTAAAVSVLITDYVRKALGYNVYDATPQETKRAITELQDYHERVTNLQYFPSPEETEYLMPRLPVEISGDPSEKIQVSNNKDLPRIPTNLIRSGYCLVLSSCIPLKAPKIWKQLSKWGKEFGMEHWNFLEEYLAIQKKVKSGKTKKDTKTDAKISPDYTYIKDMVAGRPVLGHPLKQGAFRLRYGRSRTSGFSAQSMHPATMYLLNQYIAIGTQLKTERPGKAASMTSCDTIEGPTIKLTNGTVKQITTLEEAKKEHPQVQEILFLGDILVSYGDFFNRAHPLIPAGYCQEWWKQELPKQEQITQQTGIPQEKINQYINDINSKPTAQEAITIAQKTNTPLHPAHTYYWNRLTHEQLTQLLNWLDTANYTQDKITLQNNPAKRTLELIGMPHKQEGETITIETEQTTILTTLLGTKPSTHIPKFTPERTPIQNLNTLNTIPQRDKGGTFIGSRMGRPEKGKQRALTGNPHTLFPVGDEGGRLRSFQAALETKKVTANFPHNYCTTCNKETVLNKCQHCDNTTIKMWKCKLCGLQQTEKCKEHGENQPTTERTIPIEEYYTTFTKKLTIQLPELVKGVRGTSNKNHIPEHILKGILRARHDIHVYKDGTTRYDMTQLPITHYKPKEIGTTIEKLKQLGYDKDIKGQELTNDEQIIELKPQDIILPKGITAPDPGADKTLLAISKFIDEELEHIYKLPKAYNAKTPADLIGELTIVLAPHTSAGIVGRIIGYSDTQGLFAHPLLHAATRRDCDGDEACVILLMDAFLNFSKEYLPESRGGTMDTPLVLTSILNPTEVDDMAFDIDIPWQYPQELYTAAQDYKPPWEVKVEQINKHLNTPRQYQEMGYTHDTTNINNGVLCSVYKTAPSMEEKLKGQLNIAEKISAVDETDVARLVIEKHFLKDTKGNLRKFSMQQFRCVGCNAKYRRPPLIGKCTTCNGKIIFTISQGSIIKYLEPTLSIAKKYKVSPYLIQTIEILSRRIDDVFGKEKEKQTGLGSWY